MSKIAISELNASSADIINTIRANATPEYMRLVPEVQVTTDIPKVGEVLYGYPALANQFITSLVDRIGNVLVTSRVYANPYEALKKGELPFGKTIEEVYVGLAQGRDFSFEKASAREFARTIPDVRTAFHTINWFAQYPVTVERDELKTAFLSEEGVTALIEKITMSVYNAARYDEFLLFKYLIIKAVAHGKMHTKPFVSANTTNAAKAFRGTSNALTFMSNAYNAQMVRTFTPKEDQVIFMDSAYNAEYDVEVLAKAFNMDRATFDGKLYLLDSFNTFDNERFETIRANSTMLEVVTAEELALMGNVKAVLLDKNWFQVYDTLNVFTEARCAAGLYWNYFFNCKKIISSSPFSNAVAFVDASSDTSLPENFVLEVTAKNVSEHACVFTLAGQFENASLKPSDVVFEQDETATENLIAVHRFGGIIFPASSFNVSDYFVYAQIAEKKYKSATPLTISNDSGDTIVMEAL